MIIKFIRIHGYSKILKRIESTSTYIFRDIRCQSGSFTIATHLFISLSIFQKSEIIELSASTYNRSSNQILGGIIRKNKNSLRENWTTKDIKYKYEIAFKFRVKNTKIVQVAQFWKKISLTDSRGQETEHAYGTPLTWNKNINVNLDVSINNRYRCISEYIMRALSIHKIVIRRSITSLLPRSPNNERMNICNAERYVGSLFDKLCQRIISIMRETRPNSFPRLIRSVWSFRFEKIYLLADWNSASNQH